MPGILRKLAARLDTFGAEARMQSFRHGWPARTSPDVKFYRSPKVQYRYRERGAGPTIVFSVDPPGTLEVYDDLLAAFAAHFRMLVVELPAMGFSAAQGDYGFEWRETNEDLADFLREVAGEQAILAFSCVAGLAAVDIAARHPALVSRLVLLQTGDVAAFVRWKARRDPRGVLARPFVGQYLMKRIARKRMPAWYQLSVGNTNKLDRFCSCAEESFKQGALWSLASAYQIYMDPGIELPVPGQPILAIWGLADRSHPPENAASPQMLSGNVTYHALADCGHCPELEDPETILRLVRAFVTDASGAECPDQILVQRGSAPRRGGAPS